MKHQLFVDGGVVGKNPSEIGGTWAARLVANGVVIAEQSDIITPAEARLERVTNNQTEMLALIRGLGMLPAGWLGTVYTDSMVTLGRAKMGWRWNNLPVWMHVQFQHAVGRLAYWPEIQLVLLAGHPTQAELRQGVNREGWPVSEHNVWCDRACRAEARKISNLMAAVK